jgi:hypothetical protein
MWATPVLPVSHAKTQQASAYNFVGARAKVQPKERSRRTAATKTSKTAPTGGPHHHYPEYPAYEPLVASSAAGEVSAATTATVAPAERLNFSGLSADFSMGTSTPPRKKSSNNGHGAGASAPLRTPSPVTPVRPLPTMSGGPIAGLTPSPMTAGSRSKRDSMDVAAAVGGGGNIGDDGSNSSAGSSLSVLHAARSGFEQSGQKLDREIARLHNLVAASDPLLSSSFFKLEQHLRKGGVLSPPRHERTPSLQHVLPLVPSLSATPPPLKRSTPKGKKAEMPSSPSMVQPISPSPAAAASPAPSLSYAAILTTPPERLTRSGSLGRRSRSPGLVASLRAKQEDQAEDPLELFLKGLPGYPWTLGSSSAAGTTDAGSPQQRAASPPPPAPRSPPQHKARSTPSSRRASLPSEMSEPVLEPIAEGQQQTAMQLQADVQLEAPQRTPQMMIQQQPRELPPRGPSVWQGAYDGVFPATSYSARGVDSTGRAEDAEKTRLLLVGLQQLRNIEETQRYVAARLPSVATAGNFAWARHQTLATQSSPSFASQASAIAPTETEQYHRLHEGEVRTPPFPWQGQSKALSGTATRSRSAPTRREYPLQQHHAHYQYGYQHSNGHEGSQPVEVTTPPMPLFAANEEQTLESIRASGRGQLSTGAAVAAMEAFSTVAAPERTIAAGVAAQMQQAQAVSSQFASPSNYSYITTPTASYNRSGVAPAQHYHQQQVFSATASSYPPGGDEESTAGVMTIPTSYSFAGPYDQQQRQHKSWHYLAPAHATGNSPPQAAPVLTSPAIAIHQNPLRALAGQQVAGDHFPTAMNHFRARTDYAASARGRILRTIPYEQAQERGASATNTPSPLQVPASFHQQGQAAEKNRPRSPWRGQYAASVKGYYSPKRYQEVARALSPKSSTQHQQAEQGNGHREAFQLQSPTLEDQASQALGRGYLGSLLSSIGGLPSAAGGQAAGSKRRGLGITSSKELEEIKQAWMQYLLMNR